MKSNITKMHGQQHIKKVTFQLIDEKQHDKSRERTRLYEVWEKRKDERKMYHFIEIF